MAGKFFDHRIPTRDATLYVDGQEIATGLCRLSEETEHGAFWPREAHKIPDPLPAGQVHLIVEGKTLPLYPTNFQRRNIPPSPHYTFQW